MWKHLKFGLPRSWKGIDFQPAESFSSISQLSQSWSPEHEVFSSSKDEEMDPSVKTDIRAA